MIPNCLPTYNYHPNYVPSNVTCSIVTYNKHRSRVTILDPNYIPQPPLFGAHGLFFRSVDQSLTVNDFAVEQTETQFRIYYQGSIVRTYPVSVGVGQIAVLRNLMEGNGPVPYNVPDPYLEMPPFQFDIYDTIRTVEDDLFGGIFEYGVTALTGGDGPPNVNPDVIPVKTGPTRSMIIVATYEDIHGNSVTPPPEERVTQWDGTKWISYCNLIQGICPGDGTC